MEKIIAVLLIIPVGIAGLVVSFGGVSFINSFIEDEILNRDVRGLYFLVLSVVIMIFYYGLAEFCKGAYRKRKRKRKVGYDILK